MKKLRNKLMLAGASFLFINFCNAQDNQSPLDFVNKQLSEQKLNQLRAISTPRLIQTQAEYYRNLYQALIKTGFTKEEALQILLAKVESGS